MSEWALVLMMLTARQEWKSPNPPPAALMSTSSSVRTLSTEERAELRQAVERMARESNGELARDSRSGLFVPVSLSPRSEEVVAAVRQ